MKIGGLQKVSLIDFPGLIAAIVFTKGCNFFCPFCFNRDLVLGNLPTISQRTILSFLKKRQKVLDGVVLSGGEPLLQPGLPEFISKIKKLGYQVKLDTNGAFPKQLKNLLQTKLIDYVALDFKAPLDGRYSQVVGIEDFNPKIWQQSLQFLLKSKIPFELRTTVVPGIHDQKALTEMAKQLKNIVGAKKIDWYWQNFQPKNCLDPQFAEKKPFEKEQLEKFLKAVKKHYPLVAIRPF